MDIGGTFTDVVLLGDDGSGSVRGAKVLSTPDEYARGVVVGAVALLAQHGVGADDFADVVHASTVAWVELDEASVREAARQIRDEGVEAVAIALLHAYADDAHERRVESIVHTAVGEDVYV